jgi:hypothetical protein
MTWRDRSSKACAALRLRIAETIKRNPGLSASDLQERFGVSSDLVREIAKDLGADIRARKTYQARDPTAGRVSWGYYGFHDDRQRSRCFSPRTFKVVLEQCMPSFDAATQTHLTERTLYTFIAKLKAATPTDAEGQLYARWAGGTLCELAPGLEDAKQLRDALGAKNSAKITAKIS